MEGKITKKGELKAGNETYLYEIDLYTDNENGPTRSGDFSICEKNCRSSKVSPEFLGPYYRSDDMFEKSLVEFVQQYLKEHTFDEFKQYMKSDPKIEIAGMQMDFSMPQFIFY